MRKLLLVFLIVLPCVVIAQNKKVKKTPKVIEWSDGEGTFRIYPNHVTVIGGGEYTAPKEEPKSKAKTENNISQRTYNAGTSSYGKVTKDCKCEGKPLKGRVKVLEAGADFKVKVVHVYPDIRVKRVHTCPDECGQWQFVEAAPDFTIQFVDVYPDFTIQFVDVYPGVE